MCQKNKIIILLLLLGSIFKILPNNLYFIDSSISVDKCHQNSTFGFLKRRLRQFNIELLDLPEDIRISDLNSDSTFGVFYCDIPDKYISLIEQVDYSKNILFLQEPPAVRSYYYEKNFLNYFSKVLTWNDDLVDNKKFFKYRNPVRWPMLEDLTSFNDRKFCVMIAGYKSSNVKGELYSERIKIAKFINDFNKNLLDIYGFGDWQRENLNNYKGFCNDKLGTLGLYKYSICYENSCNIKGYITEKIFDCFLTGTIPVYWGASNITDSIPANCFINREEFSSDLELVEFLISLNELDYNYYLHNIKQYMASEKSYEYSFDNFLDNIVKIILT